MTTRKPATGGRRMKELGYTLVQVWLSQREVKALAEEFPYRTRTQAVRLCLAERIGADALTHRRKDYRNRGSEN